MIIKCNYRIISMFLIGIMLVCPAFTQEFYVSPTGNDNNNGSLNAPWKTLEKARSHIRSINENMTEDINIYFRAGTYYLDTTLKFGPEDSASNNYHISYQGYKNEVAVISGGKMVTGWTQHHGNIWKAKLKRDTKLRQLYVNGARAFMAKSKKKIKAMGEWGSFLIHGTESWALNGDTCLDGIKFSPKDLPLYDNPDDVEIYQKQEGAWRDYFLCFRDITKEGKNHVGRLQQPMGAMIREIWNARLNPQGDFLVINAFDLLDEPGEFYFNKKSHTLYYYKQNSEDMNNAEVIAPVLEKIINIQGHDTMNHVTGLNFQKLVFSHTHWPLSKVENSYGWCSAQNIWVYEKFSKNMRAIPEGSVGKDGKVFEEYDDRDIQEAAIEVYNSSKISFNNNHFQHIGAVGISYTNDVQHSTIIGNYFSDIGSSALNVSHPHHRWLNGGPIFPKNIEEKCSNISVSNNVLRSIGVETSMAASISVNFGNHTAISHNDMFLTPYSSISFGLDWGRDDLASNTMAANEISYNKIDLYNIRFKDGGAIYTLGTQDKDRNTNAKTMDTKYWSKQIGNAVFSGWGMGYYADEGSRFWTVDNCAIAGGAWLVANPGAGDIHTSNIYTGIGYKAGFESNIERNILTKNINHEEWDWLNFSSPAGYAKIVKNAGVEDSYKKLIPKNLLKSQKSKISKKSTYWDIDLGSSKDLDYLLLLNNRSPNLKNFYIFVSDQPFSSSDSNITKATKNVWQHFYQGSIKGFSHRLDSVPLSTQGRYLRIQTKDDSVKNLTEIRLFENKRKIITKTGN